MGLAFPTALKSLACVWLKCLKPASAQTFEQLSMSFVENFATAMIRGMNIKIFMSLSQNYG